MTKANHRFNRRNLLKASGAAGVLATTPIASLSPALATPATPVSLPPGVESAITETMQAMQIPGANILIEHEGATTWKLPLGVSDIETGRPMLSNMHMRIGSITKTMTATAVLLLVDDELLSLDDTLADVMPEISAFPYAKEMTIRQMLNMRSGAFNYLEDETVFMAMATESTRPWTPDELIDTSLVNDPYFAPGEGFAYSNTNYILLGMIVEQLAGQTLADMLDERIFAPLGMTHTNLPDDVHIPVPYARGYGVDITSDGATPVAGESGGLKDWTEINPTMAGASGGAISTTSDLRIWLDELIDGTLLSDEMRQEQLDFQPVDTGSGGVPFSYGLGIANFDGMIGHDGSIFGFEAFAGHDPETSTSIITLINLSPSTSGASAFGLTIAIRDALADGL